MFPYGPLTHCAYSEITYLSADRGRTGHRRTHRSSSSFLSAPSPSWLWRTAFPVRPTLFILVVFLVDEASVTRASWPGSRHRRTTSPRAKMILGTQMGGSVPFGLFLRELVSPSHSISFKYIYLPIYISPFFFGQEMCTNLLHFRCLTLYYFQPYS